MFQQEIRGNDFRHGFSSDHIYRARYRYPSGSQHFCFHYPIISLTNETQMINFLYTVYIFQVESITLNRTIRESSLSDAAKSNKSALTHNGTLHRIHSEHTSISSLHQDRNGEHVARLKVRLYKVGKKTIWSTIYDLINYRTDNTSS